MEKKLISFCTFFIDNFRFFEETVETEYFPKVTKTISVYKIIDTGNTSTTSPYSWRNPTGLCPVNIVKEYYVNHDKICYTLKRYGVILAGSPSNRIVMGHGSLSWSSNTRIKDCKFLCYIKKFNYKNCFIGSVFFSPFKKLYRFNLIRKH
jgi:hypothetical protein